MSELTVENESQITKIFAEYRAKMAEIDKKSDVRGLRPADPEPYNAIDHNYEKLAEIIINKQPDTENIPVEAEESVSEEAAEIIRDLEEKLHHAKRIIGAYKNELNIKYGNLDRAFADARKKLEFNSISP